VYVYVYIFSLLVYFFVILSGCWRINMIIYACMHAYICEAL